MKSLVGLVFAAALLNTCPGPDQYGRDTHERAAFELLDLQNGGVLAWELAYEAVALRERMAWFREQVGHCDRVEFYRSSESGRLAEMDAKQFVFHCEHGQLQALIGIDEDGRATTLCMGARSIPPPARVRIVADEWLASPAGQRRNSECRIDRVAVGGVTGALFVLTCPTGEKTLRVELDDEGQPRRIHVTKGASDEWRSLG